ncbi:type IV pilus modification PilV family protein [Paenibacillus gallinarum]|uniref:Type II secretion system protein n=1 Tax=Paenibacillus gallinarum TaxID=2762232 RepID=A0ABR8SWH3_9BACL|nr:type II secretion system protein [Paenibacillus gallinarum]MBD7967684.1 type II secretion system protein [Paenibacillus gallinarum]
MKVQIQKEEGFTLVEVLAATIILSIVSLVVVSYFMNAHSYAKSNQNKTVMVNLARNALVYLEKQDFTKMEEYFKADKEVSPIIKGSSCTQVTECKYDSLFMNAHSLPEVLNPKVNNVQYELVISYQSKLHQQLQDGTKLKSLEVNSGIDSAQDRESSAGYLLPVKVTVIGPGGPRGHRSEAVVEGYITDEKIRR